MPLPDQPDGIAQIKVPPKLPMILKQFCKAAIRTQPYDLLKWSSAYFRALANGEEPPVKLRLEYPGRASSSGLTLGYLKVMVRQLGDYNASLSMDKIIDRWDSLCLGRDDLRTIILIGKFRRECELKKFCAIALGLLTHNLTETMTMVCELFTHEPEGGSAMIPLGLFVEIFGYLAGLPCEDSDPDDWDFNDDEKSEILIGLEDLNECPAKVDTGPSSHASQDTNADIDIDCESLSKDDVIAPIPNDSDISEEKSASVLSAHSTEPTSSMSSITEPLTRESKHSSMQTDDVECCCLKDKKRRDKCECPCCASISKRASARASMDFCQAVFADAAINKFQPDIPGIGPRLTPEEVTSVALWLSDCARRQQGMVAPRNLRHMYCPPLDRRYKSDKSY